MVSNPIYLGATEGIGFPNLPDFRKLGDGSEGLKIAAGDAIKISRITISDLSYSRIGVNTDDETITVDAVTNKLKSLVRGVFNYSENEIDTGQQWIDNKKIYCKVISGTTSESTSYTKVVSDITGADKIVFYDGLIRTASYAYPLNCAFSGGSTASSCVDGTGIGLTVSAGLTSTHFDIRVFYTKA